MSIGLIGQRMLEFGCRAGFEIWSLDHWCGAGTADVDVVASWVNA